jgi:hypothetical protein
MLLFYHWRTPSHLDVVPFSQLHSFAASPLHSTPHQLSHCVTSPADSCRDALASSVKQCRTLLSAVVLSFHDMLPEIHSGVILPRIAYGF